MANIVIDIASEFTGAKAFKQADSATQKLTSGVKKLAGAIGLAYGTSSVIAFGKASVRAAAADQKAQQQLALALKNVGLERDAASAESYIQRLQSEFGIVDDLLRPAYQSLAIATRDTAESQRLLNLSLDISAATGKDLGSVTAALSKAYLGNNTALTRLGVGISKADLKTKSFYEITTDLANTFEGSATAAASTFQGSMDKLAVASANVQEIIGTGLIDALTNLGNSNSVNDLAKTMEQAAEYTADVIRGVGVLADKLKALPGVSSLNLGMIPILGSYLETLRGAGQASQIKPKPFTTPMTISGQTQVKQQTQITKLTQQQAAATSKIAKDKKTQALLDKANAALLKGGEVFDMERIQVAAALTNQAEQLGKATNVAQVLQIASDTARLNVKRSILDLESAIASKDEAQIAAATSKLEADLKILAAITNQKFELQDIQSILDTLEPEELIDQANLDEALRKILEMLALLNSMGGGGGGGGGGKTPLTKPKKTSIIPENDYIEPISKDIAKLASVDAIVEYADAATERANAFALIIEQQNYSDYLDLIAYQRSVGDLGGYSRRMNAGGGYGSGNTIIVNTGVGDPNAIAEAVNQVLQDAVDRGTLRGGSL
jgi:hypothetical protein